MDNTELFEEIEYWNEKISSSKTSEILELAFFKIFIKFEKFLSDLFVNYCIGENSLGNYCPERKLCFTDEEHLNAILQKEKKMFINHYDLILKLSDHIFAQNPFEIISRDANFSSEIRNMKIIRDYIAHESNHAKKKFSEALLNGKENIKPFEFLAKKKKSRAVSYYSYYIEIIKETSNYIINGPAT